MESCLSFMAAAFSASWPVSDSILLFKVRMESFNRRSYAVSSIQILKSGLYTNRCVRISVPYLEDIWLLIFFSCRACFFVRWPNKGVTENSIMMNSQFFTAQDFFINTG